VTDYEPTDGVFTIQFNGETFECVELGNGKFVINGEIYTFRDALCFIAFNVGARK
jgi:hypothetical protein